MCGGSAATHGELEPAGKLGARIEADAMQECLVVPLLEKRSYRSATAGGSERGQDEDETAYELIE